MRVVSNPLAVLAAQFNSFYIAWTWKIVGSGNWGTVWRYLIVPDYEDCSVWDMRVHLASPMGSVDGQLLPFVMCTATTLCR